MKKRLKLLSFAIFLTFFSTVIANAYYWPPSNVPPGPPPNYTQIDTTYFLGIPSLPLPPPDSGGVYIWYDQGMWQVANHIYSKGYSLEQFHCSILALLDQPPTPGVNVFADEFELISDTTKHSQCYRQNDRWGWKRWGENLYEIWWDVCTREWKQDSGDPNDFMRIKIAGCAVDFNIWSSGHSGPFDADEIFLGANKTPLSTIPEYYDYFSGISDPYQSQAGSDPTDDPNVTIFTKKDDTLRTYNLNGLINPADSYFCDSYFPYGDYGSRYSGTFAYEGNGVQFSTQCVPIENHYPYIELPEDSSLLVCTGDSVCIPIFASDPDPEDTITVEKVSGAGIYNPVTALTPIYDTMCFVPDTSGVYEFIFKVTDQHGLADYDTTYYTITLNSPPTVIAPDSNEFLCNPGDSVNFDVSATDPNIGQNLTLEKISGPGSFAPVNGTSPLSGTQKWAPTTAGTYNFIYKVTDECGATDYDTATWVISFNTPPVVSAPDSNKFLCNPDTIMFNVTGTDTDPNDTLTLELVSGPGVFSTVTGPSPVNGTLKYYVTATDTSTFIFKVTDKCGAVDYDTATWFVIKDATTPVVTAPDSNKTFCGPDTIRFTVTATDANPYDTLSLYKYSGPGTFYTTAGNPPLSGELEYYVTASGTYEFVFKAMDKCGRYDFDTATYVITMNNPPTVTAPDDSAFFCGSDTIRFTVTATDPDAGDTLTLSGPGIPTPIKGVSPLSADIKIYVNSAGTYDYVYTVTDLCNTSDTDTATWTITMNNPPTVAAPDSSEFFCGPDTIRFTVTATDPDAGDTLTLSGPGIPTPITGVSPLYADVKFYIDSSGTYNYVYQVTNHCGFTDYDTATWVVTINNPPTVNAPDSSKFFCGPDTIRFTVTVTVTATDPDAGDTLTLSGPGIPTPIKGVSPLSADIKIYVSSAGTYDYIYTVTDLCNVSDVDTATYNITMNNPPTVNAPDSSKFFCNPDTIMFQVCATDSDAGDTITLEGPGIPTPIKGVSPVCADVKFYINTSGTYDYVYKVTNGCGAEDYDTATWIVTINSPPTLNVPQSIIACLGDTARFTVTGDDPDKNYDIALQKVAGVGSFTNLSGKPSLTGTWSWVPDASDTLSNPHLVIFKVTDHCDSSVTDTVLVIVQNCACDIYVKIGEADCANPGDTVSIPILLKTSELLGGFDLRIEFDPTVLYLLNVTRGSELPSGWEYFTYRQLPCPMCGCCKYKLLLLGLYDIKDLHAGEPIEPNSDYIEIARVKFQVANNNNLRGFFVNVCFEWDEGNCTQNTFSDPTGYILYISSNPDEFSYAECDTQFHPGNEVLNRVCFEPCGGIQICTTEEKVIGDINLNHIPYDPADLTLFSSYFIYGEDVFMDDPYWRSVQIANTDVNRDGFTLTLSDFIYMIRVILNDAPPLSKLVPEESQLKVLVASRNSEHIITFDSRSPIGAAVLVFKPKGEVGIPELTTSQMEMRYAEVKGEFRVLIYSFAGNSISSGNNEVLRIKAEEGIELTSIEAVDPYGRPLTVTTTAKALPEEFTLNPNYPNPFNPQTNISFALPIDSRVSLKIYNLSGQLVKTLLDNNLSAGTYTVTWDGTNSSEERVASGIYFYKLTAGNYSQTRKMCLVK